MISVDAAEFYREHNVSRQESALFAHSSIDNSYDSMWLEAPSDPDDITIIDVNHMSSSLPLKRSFDQQFETGPEAEQFFRGSMKINTVDPVLYSRNLHYIIRSNVQIYIPFYLNAMLPVPW